MSHQSHDGNGSAPDRRRLGRGFLRFVGLRANGLSHGVHDRTQNGGPNGDQDGYQNGTRDGITDGVHNGFTEGTSDDSSDGHQHGTRHGYQQGNPNGARQVTDIEQALGLEFHLVDGLVLAYQPGHRPNPHAKDHAVAFLRWLQSEDRFPGNEVPARLLQDGLYPLFCSSAGWEPYAWRTIAGHFKCLPGVKRRQYDGRTGGDRTGSMPIVYKIPRPKG